MSPGDLQKHRLGKIPPPHLEKELDARSSFAQIQLSSNFALCLDQTEARNGTEGRAWLAGPGSSTPDLD